MVEGSANTAQSVVFEPAHVTAPSHPMLLPGLSLAHSTLVPHAIVKADATATALVALRPLAIVRAKKTATALGAPRPLAMVVAKIQVFKVVHTSARAIQRMPRAFLPQHLPAG